MTASGRGQAGRKKKNLGNRRVEPKKDYIKIVSRVLQAVITGLCALAVLAGIAFAMYLLSVSEAFRIEQIEVQGNQRLSDADIIALSDIRQGQGTFDLDLGLIGKRLRENAWISRARIERLLPGGIRISVVEYSPCCIINLGFLYYVDQDATVFKVLHDGDSLDYPLVSGFERSDLEGENAAEAPGKYWLEQVVKALNEIKKRDIFTLDEVAQIHVDFDRGLELYTLKCGVPLRLGKDNFASKLDVLERMYPDLKQRLCTLEYIDLNVPGKLIVKQYDAVNN